MLAALGGLSCSEAPSKPTDTQKTSDALATRKASDAFVRAINQGVALMNQYNYKDAAAVLEEAVKVAPDSVEARVNLAIAIYNRATNGDLERATALVDTVVHDEPGNVRAQYFRGLIHHYAGEDEQALAYFQRVVEQTPGDAYAWFLLGRCKRRLGQPCRAELERAIQENPGLASAHYEFMLMVALQEGREAAAPYREKFAKIDKSPLSEKLDLAAYNRMGPLAVVRPLAAVPAAGVSSGELASGAAQTLVDASASDSRFEFKARRAADIVGRAGVQLALADVNGDGRLDIATTGVVRDDRPGLLLLLAEEGGFIDATQAAGLAGQLAAVSCAFGDYDNDDKVDIYVSCVGPNRLFRGRGDGTFEDVTDATGTAGPNVTSVSAVFLDADHDADLDIYVCNAASAAGASAAANQLLNNNADGTFTDIAADAGVACAAERSVMLAPVDIDADRDTDLLVFNDKAQAKLFFNDRFGKYREGQITAEPIRGDRGGVLQDFNGDGRADLLVAPGGETPGRLYLTDATGAFAPSKQFDGCLEAVSTWGDLVATRVADVDLDGDLDVAVFGAAGHVLLNDGAGRFVTKANLWPKPAEGAVVGTDLVDLTGDGVPDVLRVRVAPTGRVELVPTTLTPPANWLAVTPTGDRGADKRTRSPASGYGTKLDLRCGLHSQVITHTGLNGGLSQSQRPVVFGLSGATKLDYLAFTWPDGVTQSEIELAAGMHHRISETERKMSSCPVLFAWNGERFGFVTDFAGVGGLGYYVAPSQYAPPQVLEHVKIEPDQLAARDGVYELRICEPMEEVGYIDRLELLAVDHPRDVSVYPDERLALNGPAPSHKLLCPADRIYPVRATAPDNTDCTRQLAAVDRIYAYQPPLDRRFQGFCKPHALVLDFDKRLAELDPGRSVYLFLNGWIEYPYSQTTFAAAQAGVKWQPLKIERQTTDGRWETAIADAGAPGGMGRMITVDLTGKLAPNDTKLRISTNLEVYYDQIFIAADEGTEELVVRTVPLAEASLRRLGFPQEYSPDGGYPLLYAYDIIEPTAPFKMPRGAYTRYGRVDELLTDFDDRYVILGSGDEIAARFDASELPAPRDGHVRSFILVSHAYCKDMDLYTAEPDTVTPLPFRAMSRYPYPPSERFPATSASRPWQEKFNTRRLP